MKKMGPVLASTHTVLDVLLTPADFLSEVSGLWSDRLAAIASHHFPIIAIVSAQLSRSQAKKRKPRHDFSYLEPAMFKCVTKSSEEFHGEPDVAMRTPIDAQWNCMRQNLLDVVSASIPVTRRVKSKPWISQATLDLIELQDDARRDGLFEEEKQRKKDIKRSVKRDRADWLRQLASKGDWKSLQQLRKGRRVQQTRLHRDDGNPVSTEERANTFADYLEQVQWRVRPVNVLPDIPRQARPSLPILETNFTHSELRKAINNMASGKSVCEGDVPIEVYKILAKGGGNYIEPLLSLMNECLQCETLPKEWLMARVAMIFKKGDPALMENYRPICLTAVAYRIFASMVKQRLLDAGLDERLWESQFGFRKKRSTEDAIYIARRHIELAKATRSGRLSVLALDWRKAFDSINVDCTLEALRRYGITPKYLKLIEGIMRGRHFYVEDANNKSDFRQQKSGISQGCTLSPLLFITVMSAIMADAVAQLSPGAREAYRKNQLADIGYADDTLLLGMAPEHVEEFLQCVGRAGQSYGLELHPDKLQLLQVNDMTPIRLNDEHEVKSHKSMTYLGATISPDGRMTTELNRRIGMAKADFRSIRQVWTRSTLSKRRKLEIYAALVESKLLYSL